MCQKILTLILFGAFTQEEFLISSNNSDGLKQNALRTRHVEGQREKLASALLNSKLQRFPVVVYIPELLVFFGAVRRAFHQRCVASLSPVNRWDSLFHVCETFVTCGGWWHISLLVSFCCKGPVRKAKYVESPRVPGDAITSLRKVGDATAGECCCSFHKCQNHFFSYSEGGI